MKVLFIRDRPYRDLIIYDNDNDRWKTIRKPMGNKRLWFNVIISQYKYKNVYKVNRAQGKIFGYWQRIKAGQRYDIPDNVFDCLIYMCRLHGRFPKPDNKSSEELLKDLEILFIATELKK